MGIGSNIGKALLAQAPDMAPGAAVSMLRSILGFAIDGASSLPGARQAAGKTLTKHDGDVEQAISSLVNQHIAMARCTGIRLQPRWRRHLGRDHPRQYLGRRDRPGPHGGCHRPPARLRP